MALKVHYHKKSNEPHDLYIDAGNATISARWVDFVNIVSPEVIEDFVYHKNETPCWSLSFGPDDDGGFKLLDYALAVAEWCETGDYDVEWYLAKGTTFRHDIPFSFFWTEMQMHISMLGIGLLQRTSKSHALCETVVRKIKALFRKKFCEEQFHYGCWLHVINGFFLDGVDNKYIMEIIDELTKIGLEHAYEFNLTTIDSLNAEAIPIFKRRYNEFRKKLFISDVDDDRFYRFRWDEISFE
ncbi:hypothetical protein AAP_05514 [Ascosphaera apis ARSEF 7405]|uniref:Uncharacterized protein n=1 Tax=Ascosphaera apis ARSEF 7405 TaxID=392613 RepID=A0A162I213_9EURO|nr:hypothetical protein AAP_05514 [Ascosphaera apis ARSEF 7405]